MVKKFFVFVLIFLVSFSIVFADHEGDYYDNRDGNHANLGLTYHPGVIYMSSGYGAQTSLIADKVVIGNASLAVTSGAYWGSMTRYNLMSQYGATAAYNQYVGNNAYWYPEHRDHDEVDYYYGQTPAVNNSQGSSGSELDEVGKWFYTLDAFKPDVKTLLKSRGLLMPTIQMIARRTRVATDEDYLKGTAHPNAFDNFDNKVAMVSMASAMTVDNVPPMVKLSVVEDGYASQNGKDYFESYASEKTYDTPVSIARVFRGREYTKRIVVTAKDSFDANGKSLTYHWKVLRGDPSHVKINPRRSDSSEVEILIDYHPEAIIEGTTRPSNLVSVGAFVNNGKYYSAPAFVTSYSLRNEIRDYDLQTKRLRKITYAPNHLDLRVSAPKTWLSDTFSYDSGGNLSGWQRLKADQTTQEFTKEGYLITTKNSDGTPKSVSAVSYSLNTSNKLIYGETGAPFDYLAPSMSIVTPKPETIVSGTVNISAEVGGSLIPECSMKIDDIIVATKSSAPCQFAWDSTSVSDGFHVITVVAKTKSGATTEAGVTVNVDNSISETYGPRDFSTLIASWKKGLAVSTLDLNEDGAINARDLGIMMTRWR